VRHEMDLMKLRLSNFNLYYTSVERKIIKTHSKELKELQSYSVAFLTFWPAKCMLGAAI
jgi:hypothetical protein